MEKEKKHGMTERVYPREMGTASDLESMMKDMHLRRYRFACDWLRRHLGGRPARIADIACGSGYGTEMLADLGTVIGADIDADAVAYARAHYAGPRTSFVVGNADDPAFLATLGTFDAVVTSATVEHVDDAERFLRWIRGALRPGGACVACFPAAITMDWAAPHHKRDLSLAGAERLFAHVGLHPIERHHETYRVSLGQIRAEIRANKGIPVPPLGKWVRYYLAHPHHLALRLWQMSLGGGILFGDQDYLLVPAEA
jgi:SAM-dependent methyltransferase